MSETMTTPQQSNTISWECSRCGLYNQQSPPTAICVCAQCGNATPLEDILAPQQPEQAETPVVGEVMPDWMRREVDCGRKSKIAGPRTRALLWLADALAASQARAESAEVEIAMLRQDLDEERGDLNEAHVEIRRLLDAAMEGGL